MFKSKILVQAGIAVNYYYTTIAYALSVNDCVIEANATSAAFNLTLPSAIDISGQFYLLKKTDSSANIVTIKTTGEQTIDGASSYLLELFNEFVELVSNGSNWIVVSE